MLLILLGVWAVNWIIPQLELLKDRGSKTRWQRYRTQGLAAISAITSAILLPILYLFLQKQLGL